MTHVIDILPLNLPGAEEIVKRKLNTYGEIATAANKILAIKEVKSVLITGGHFKDEHFCQDYWTNGESAFWLSNKRLPRHFSGASSIFASAMNACLTQGYELKDALVIARMYVNQVIRKSAPLREMAEVSLQSHWPEDEIDLPYLTAHPISNPIAAFNPMASNQLGLYPIVDSSHWLETLLPLGVKTVQLRIKNKQGAELENEIKRSISLANQYQANLFINDYWELALRHSAYGVHLGQEDLDTADIAAIRKAGLQLGISTHCYFEVARAHALRPSYIACGPIYPTTSKIMSFPAQGIPQLKRWRRTLNYPLVAIGGIDLARLPEILATQVDGIALISAITEAQNPVIATKDLMAMVNDYVTYHR